MNPILRKLSKPSLACSEAASLLEKHIGVGENAQHCMAAIDALGQLRDAEGGPVARVLARLAIADGDNPCVVVREVIEYLRNVEAMSSENSNN